MQRQALLGHVSFETAFEVDGYPYGQLRTKKRYWTETKPKFGMRLVECTLNPKNGRWNKPHPGQYAEVIVMYLEPQPDGRAFVEHVGLSLHSEDQAINRLRLLVGDDALRGVWDLIERNRKIRDVLNNRYREPDKQVRTAPLPSFENLLGAIAGKALCGCVHHAEEGSACEHDLEIAIKGKAA